MKKYIAITGIDFEGLKDKPRVEVGDPIPDGVSDKEIAELLVAGIVKEDVPVKKESK